jgi:hypothetical protein
VTTLGLRCIENPEEEWAEVSWRCLHRASSGAGDQRLLAIQRQPHDPGIEQRHDRP